EEARPVLRTRWSDLGLRDALLLALVEPPEEGDRERFLDGLDSSQPRLVRASLRALDWLPRDPDPGHLVPVLQALRSLLGEPREGRLRQVALALIARQSGREFRVAEDETDPASLKRAYRPVFDWFEREHPAEARRLDGAEDAGLAS